MASIITTPHQGLRGGIHMRWGCSRCGHTGGRAKCAIPIDMEGNLELWNVLMNELRKKLTMKHLAKQGCAALPHEFILERCNPNGDLIDV